MQSQLDILQSGRWVFVNYVPGSFGSFLMKILEHSEDVAGIKNQEFFDENLASHLASTYWIKNWHHGDEINRWLNLPYEQQQQFLLANIDFDLIESIDQRSLLVHRLTIPNKNDQIMYHWSNARFVIITLDQNHINLVVDQMTRKTFKVWLATMISRKDRIAKILSKNDTSSQIEFYRKECKKRILGTMVPQCDQDPRIFEWPVACFLDHKLFQQKYQDLTQWLGIRVNDISDLYQKFYKMHQFGVLI